MIVKFHAGVFTLMLFALILGAGCLGSLELKPKARV